MGWDMKDMKAIYTHVLCTILYILYILYVYTLHNSPLLSCPPLNHSISPPLGGIFSERHAFCSVAWDGRGLADRIKSSKRRILHPVKHEGCTS